MDLHKFPRLFVTGDLTGDLVLDDAQAHYLKTVLRHQDGDMLRVFNGHDGEHLARLAFTGKRDITARLDQQIKPQPVRTRRLHLFFAPLKKDRLDQLIDCAVQLDATDLHPVLTDRTELREVKEDKLNAHIRESAEQCERMDLAVLHPLQPLDRVLVNLAVPLFAGLERSGAQPLRDAMVPEGDCAALIGPVGGWTPRERDLLENTKNVVPVTLGANILRSETAVAALLTRLASG